MDGIGIADHRKWWLVREVVADGEGGGERWRLSGGVGGAFRRHGYVAGGNGGHSV
jgi:hypothetical protein